MNILINVKGLYKFFFHAEYNVHEEIFSDSYEYNDDLHCFCNSVSNCCSWVLAFMWQVSQNDLFFNYCFRIFVFNLITHNCISQLCSIDGTLRCCQGYKLDRAQNTCIRMFFFISYKYAKESGAFYLIPKRKRFPKSLLQYLQEEN